MLALQQALHRGETLDQLKARLGLRVYYHGSLPLVGLHYDLESPKLDPIARECRGIVIENRPPWRVVAKPFSRFFNIGEDLDEFRHFRWYGSTATSKEDGSLAILYHYAGAWQFNTSGSFGDGEVYKGGPTFKKLFWQVAPFRSGLLAPMRTTLLFELCTPENKIVRRYLDGRLYLIGAFEPLGDTWWDLPDDELDTIAKALGALRPERHQFWNVAGVESFLAEKEKADPTFEGVVLRDQDGRRFKAKSHTYLSLHHLHDNGALFSAKNLVPWATRDDPSELLAYFPECEKRFQEVQAVVGAAWTALWETWRDYRDIPEQKAFALAIVPRTRFNGILFRLRKDHGPGLGTLEALKAAWRERPEKIAEILFP